MSRNPPKLAPQNLRDLGIDLSERGVEKRIGHSNLQDDGIGRNSASAQASGRMP